MVTWTAYDPRAAETHLCSIAKFSWIASYMSLPVPSFACSSGFLLYLVFTRSPIHPTTMASTNVPSSLLTTDITFALPWLNPQRPSAVEPVSCRPVKLPSPQELAYVSQKHAISVTELVQIAWTVLIEAFSPDENVQVGILRDDHLIAGNAVDTTSVASILSSLRQILSEVSERRSKIRSDYSTECFSIITSTKSVSSLLRKVTITPALQFKHGVAVC